MPILCKTPKRENTGEMNMILNSYMWCTAPQKSIFIIIFCTEVPNKVNRRKKSSKVLKESSYVFNLLHKQTKKKQNNT